MAEKFLFSTFFEDPRVQVPEAEPDGVEATLVEEFEAAAPPPPPTPTFSEEELEAARSAAFEDGRNEGRHEALQSEEHHLQESLHKLNLGIEGLQESLHKLNLGIEGLLSQADNQQSMALNTAMKLAAVLVKKLFPSLARREGLAEIENVIADCMVRLNEEPRLVVRVCEERLDQVRDRCKDLANLKHFEGRLIFIAEEAFGPADVLVEWADGGAERHLARQWQEVETILSRALFGPIKEPSIDYAIDEEGEILQQVEVVATRRVPA